MPPEDKDAALFPRRFDGRWAMIHRPSPLRGGAHMWLSYSPDLRHWGDHTLLLEARDGAWWDAGKIGLGPPPLETEEGWLVDVPRRPPDGDGPIYRVGLALLDLEDPSIVLRRSDEWIFGPRAPYERDGDVDQVVFPSAGCSTSRLTRSCLLRRRRHVDRPGDRSPERGPRPRPGLPATRAEALARHQRVRPMSCPAIAPARPRRASAERVAGSPARE